MIADAVDDDAREHGPHDESQNDRDGQEGDRNELVVAFEISSPESLLQKTPYGVKK